MDKPVFVQKNSTADEITKLKDAGEARGAKAIVGRVVHHVYGQDRVEIIRLDDGTEIIERNGGAVAKWPTIDAESYLAILERESTSQSVILKEAEAK